MGPPPLQLPGSAAEFPATAPALCLLPAAMWESAPAPVSVKRIPRPHPFHPSIIPRIGADSVGALGPEHPGGKGRGYSAPTSHTGSGLGLSPDQLFGGWELLSGAGGRRGGGERGLGGKRGGGGGGKRQSKGGALWDGAEPQAEWGWSTHREIYKSAPVIPLTSKTPFLSYTRLSKTRLRPSAAGLLEEPGPSALWLTWNLRVCGPSPLPWLAKGAYKLTYLEELLHVLYRGIVPEDRVRVAAHHVINGFHDRQHLLAENEGDALSMGRQPKPSPPPCSGLGQVQVGIRANRKS